MNELVLQRIDEFPTGKVPGTRIFLPAMSVDVTGRSLSVSSESLGVTNRNVPELLLCSIIQIYVEFSIIMKSYLNEYL